MKTISGKVISATPVSLSEAAAILSNFAAAETGASDAVSVYISRAADAFNQLVQFHHELLGPNSVHERLGNDRLGGDNSEYRLKRSENPEIIAKEEEESVKVEQSPEGKHQKKRKKKGNEEIRDLGVKVEAVVKTEPESGEIEEHRKNRNHSVEKVKNEGSIKSEKISDKGEDDRVGHLENRKYEKVKSESSLMNDPELDEVEGNSMKKKKKDKKQNKNNLSEGNEGVGEVTSGHEKKKRKSGEIDGGVAFGSAEQSNKRKNKKQRVESK